MKYKVLTDGERFIENYLIDEIILNNLESEVHYKKLYLTQKLSVFLEAPRMRSSLYLMKEH